MFTFGSWSLRRKTLISSHTDTQRISDEVTELQRALRDMHRSLTDMVGEVRSVSRDIAGRSHSIAQSNTELAERMVAQSQQLTATAPSIQPILQAVAHNAASVKEVHELVCSAALAASKGVKMVDEVNRTLTSLRDSSAQIAESLDVIEGIALQTNLLALNVARTHEPSERFAIVASEVSALAQRSAATAKQLRSVVDDSMNQVNAGIELVASTGSAMREWSATVSRVNAVIADIEFVSHQQYEAAERASSELSAIAAVTGQNRQLVNETANSANSISARSEPLSAAVSKFKVYRHWRMNVSWQARVWVDGKSVGDGVVRNLSATGAFIETSITLTSGTRCLIAMRNAAAGPAELVLEGAVVRVSGSIGAVRSYGLQFARIRQQDKVLFRQQLAGMFTEQSVAGISDHDVQDSLAAVERLSIIPDDELGQFLTVSAPRAGSYAA